MFSNDKNIETFGQLVEALKAYYTAEKESMRFSVAEKLVRILKEVILFCITFLLLIFVILFAGIAISILLAAVLPPAAAFACMACFYLVLILVVRAYSKTLIEKPLVHIIASILLEDK